MKIRFIGGVNGNYNQYLKLLDTDYSLQLGDMGLNYNPLFKVNHSKHKFIAGDNDNYIMLSRQQNPIKSYLGRYGIYEVNGLKILYIGGAFTSDDNTQLTLTEFNGVLRLYKMHQPSVIASHDCPQFIKRTLRYVRRENAFPTLTGQICDKLYNIASPKLWVFSHYNKSVSLTMPTGTNFISLSDLEVYDYKFRY